MKKILIAAICGSLFLQYPVRVIAEDEGEIDYGNESSEAVGIDVEYHTAEEIREYISENGPSFLLADYDEEPDGTNPPYSAGKLKDYVLDDALRTVNTIRYIAGLDYDVALDATYTAACQAGTLLNAINGQLSHYPSRPDGISDELYELGYSGTSRSNIAMGYSTLSDAIVSGWLYDGNSSNISRIGHRRWLLNAQLGRTGFGQVGAYTAMYALDTSGSSNRTSNVWPAQNTPLEFFGSSYPWSVSTGRSESISDVTVHMTNTKTNQTYTFSQESSDGYFNVENSGYGVSGAIIWRPDEIAYRSGDSYQIQIDGLSGGTVSYTVSFFELAENETMIVSPESVTMEVGETAEVHVSFIPAYCADHLSWWGWTYTDQCFEIKKSDTGSFLITATGAGSGTVTFHSANGLSATCSITVCQKIIHPSGISVSPSSVNVPVDKTVQLAANVAPENATDKNVKWTSSDPDIAAVDNAGRVTGINVGYATITAETEDGSYTSSADIHVLFKDVAGTYQYYFEPVYWAYENGITVGAGGPGKFSPHNPCTREQIVTFLWRLKGEPEPETESDFTDVAKDAWYYKPITWAYENGITTGLNDGTGRFGIGQPCTREQCVTFLYRTAGEPEVAEHMEFTDVSEDRYFYDAISWAASEGITVGLNDGTGRFGVGQTCTRAMIVTFLYRYAKL